MITEILFTLNDFSNTDDIIYKFTNSKTNLLFYFSILLYLQKINKLTESNFQILNKYTVVYYIAILGSMV